MSWQALAWAMKQKTGSPGCKVLLLVLANHANAHGRCWPSQETLADCTELSRKSIGRIGRELQSTGLLTISQQPRANGQWPNLEYRLNMPADPQPEVKSPTPTVGHHVSRSPSDTVSHGPWDKYAPDRGTPCPTNLKENHRKKDFQMNEAKEGQQPTGEQVLIQFHSKEFYAWHDYHRVTGNTARANLMLHQAENSRWGEWQEPTPYPPPYPVDRKQADGR